MAIEWDPTLAVGIEEIDAQHQELFRRLDGLLQAIRGGRSREEVGRVLDFLEDYVRRHFDAEQALMRERAYPARADHEAEHAAFAGEIRALRADYQREGPTAGLVIRVNTQVTGWLRSHIHRTDRVLVDWLKRRGPPRPP